MEYKFTKENFQEEVLNAKEPVLVDMFATWWIWDVLTDHKANIRLSEADILSGQYPFWLNQQSYEELMKLSGNKKW